jgi:hypothetical protein
MVMFAPVRGCEEACINFALAKGASQPMAVNGWTPAGGVTTVDAEELGEEEPDGSAAADAR